MRSMHTFWAYPKTYKKPFIQHNRNEALYIFDIYKYYMTLHSAKVYENNNFWIWTKN